MTLGVVMWVVLLAYAGFIFWMIASWSSIVSPEYGSKKNMFVSVIVPVRNEESTITSTVRSIVASNNETDKYEILVVNDHSTDYTLEVLEKLKQDITQLRVISNTPGSQGKKKAIELGVSQSKGDVIICTDGDCHVGNDWMTAHTNHYQKEEGAAMLTGPVKYIENGTLLSRLLNLELSVLVLVGAATLNRGIPGMANGANLSFKKESFLGVKGYQGNEHIPSGDDEFLLRKIWSKFPGRVAFLKEKKAIVETNSPESLQEFIQQRKRWASKWRHHSDFYSKLIPVFLFLANSMSIVAMVGLIAGYQPLTCGVFLLSKFIAEYLLIIVSTDFLGIKRSILGFFMLEIIYPFYVVFFGLASNFGKYAWKDRVYGN
ncbi:MAG: glycosyltransferase [Cyclobacteriaceae bacterium]